MPSRPDEHKEKEIWARSMILYVRIKHAPVLPDPPSTVLANGRPHPPRMRIMIIELVKSMTGWDPHLRVSQDGPGKSSPSNPSFLISNLYKIVSMVKQGYSINSGVNCQ